MVGVVGIMAETEDREGEGRETGEEQKEEEEELVGGW